MVSNFRAKTTIQFFVIFILKFGAKSSEEFVQTFRIGLEHDFVSGLSSDASLCKVFQPPAPPDIRLDQYWVGMKSIPETSDNARFIVVHRCRKSLLQNVFKKYLQRAFDCEDSRFVQVVQNCHEEILFMWSSRTYPDESIEHLPENFGLLVRPSEFLMMMVMYENIEEPFYDTSGLDLFYRTSESRPVKRLILGHQANGKHVILSGLKNWISDSFCVSQCLAQKKNSPSIDVIAVEVHTRSLGTSAQIDVRYRTGPGPEQQPSVEELAEPDKQVNETSPPTTSNKFSFPDKFFNSVGFLFPGTSPSSSSSSLASSSSASSSLNPFLSPPPIFSLPRSSDFTSQYFYDTPLLVKTRLEPDRIQSVRKVLSHHYRILSQGDDILLRCQYSSLHLNAPTFGGTESSNELCFAIITYVENEEINRNDRFNRFGSTGRQDLTSCMSHPTDRNLAVALQFNLDRYETGNYSRRRTSGQRRMKRQTEIRNMEDEDKATLKTKRRLDRQSRQSTQFILKDVFLSQPTSHKPNDEKLTSVIERIVDFNRLNNVEQRSASNVDILNGDYVTTCSNVDEGAFMSILLDVGTLASVNRDDQGSILQNYFDTTEYVIQ